MSAPIWPPRIYIDPENSVWYYSDESGRLIPWRRTSRAYANSHPDDVLWLEPRCGRCTNTNAIIFDERTYCEDDVYLCVEDGCATRARPYRREI